MKCKFISVFFIVVFFADGFSQNSQQNLKKYWFYRNRLLNDFILVGDCQGCSIPAKNRGDVDGVTLKWSDAIMDLGWYIGILGTEYKLLNDNGQNVSQTIKELYYALEAFNRLDYYAEQYWGGAPSLNGFFARDDVPEGFIGSPSDPLSNYKHFNSGIANSQRTVDTVESNYEFGINSIEESLDQAIHMMMGLALVSVCVDGNATFGLMFRDGETDKIRDESQKITDRIVNWMKIHSWRIKNPATNNCSHCISGTLPDCILPDFACGSDATAISYGFAEAACKITNKSDFTHVATGLTCFDYHEFISIANLPVWMNYQNPLVLAVTQLGAGTDGLIGLLAAMGNSWYTSVPVNPTFPPPYIVNTTNAALSAFFTSFNNFEKENIPLLRQVLHGGFNFVPNSTYEALLNSAPCEGPSNYGSCCGGFTSNEWSSDHRFRSPERRGTIDPGFKGEYPGLDYMLIHNLYYIGSGGKDSDGNDLPAYVNMLDVNLTLDFPLNIPFANNNFGSQNLPLNVGAFRSIKYSGTIHATAGDPNNTGDVTLRAGEEITLDGENFEVEEGAEFYAYSDPFECDGSGQYKSLNPSGSHDTAASKNLYGFPDGIPQKNNFIPLTYDNENYQPLNYDTIKTPLKNNKPDSAATVSTIPAKQPREVNNSKNEQPSEIPTPTYSGSNLHSPIIITPNPTTGRTVIYFSPEQITSATARLEITDVIGRKVFEKNPFGQGVANYIDLSHLQKGVYFLKIFTEDEVRVEKVVIE